MIGRLADFLRRRSVNVETFGTVFDIGTRDGLQAIELAGLFRNADVVAIECNADTLAICRKNIAPHARIRLVDKAVNSYTGRCAFHPIDRARTITTWPDGNPGASSLFLATGDYPVEQYVQNTVEVDCTRLDDLCAQLRIDVIDLIWMDLQGAELLALQSAGRVLDNVRYVYTEVSHRPLYHGQCLFDDVDGFLTARGFRRCTKVNRNRWQQDIIYENTRHLIDAVIPLGPDDRDTVELSARSVRSFVRDVRHIYVVGAEDPQIEGVRFIDERQFPFDEEAVRRGLHSAPRSTWYLQQLLKLYFPLVHRPCLDHVLAVDADTIFLQRCEFMDGERPIFNFGDEYHPAHFEHMTRLYPALHRMIAYSGITHCMLLTRAWVDALQAAVEAEHAGTPFWMTYLQSVDPTQRDDGASEAELYFNYCLMFHAGELTIRRLRWTDAVDANELEPGRYDYVSLHSRLRGEPIDRELLQRRALETSSESRP
jgi:FkbM family methyltransferase